MHDLRLCDKMWFEIMRRCSTWSDMNRRSWNFDARSVSHVLMARLAERIALTAYRARIAGGACMSGCFVAGLINVDTGHSTAHDTCSMNVFVATMML